METDDRTMQIRIKRAGEFFREFHALCFWSWPDEIPITEETIPHIIQGLRKNGGHRGYRAAAELSL